MMINNEDITTVNSNSYNMRSIITSQIKRERERDRSASVTIIVTNTETTHCRNDNNNYCK